MPRNTTAHIGAIRSRGEALEIVRAHDEVRVRYRCQRCGSETAECKWRIFDKGKAVNCGQCNSDDYVRRGIKRISELKRPSVARAVERLGMNGIAEVAKRFDTSVYAVSKIWSQRRKSLFERLARKKRGAVVEYALANGFHEAAKKFKVDFDFILALVRVAKSAMYKATSTDAFRMFGDRAIERVTAAVALVEQGILANGDERYREGEFAKSEFGSRAQKCENIQGDLDLLRSLPVYSPIIASAIEIEDRTRTARRSRQRSFLKRLKALKIFKAPVTAAPGKLITFPSRFQTAAMAA